MNELRHEFIKSCNEIHQELIKYLSNKDGDYFHFARNIHAFIHERIDSLIVLIQHNCLWDADIILRPIAEATIKLVFVSDLPGNKRTSKISEFWKDLAEINQLKQSKQAKMIIKNLKNTEFEPSIFAQIALSDEKEEELSKKWTKSKRQKMEQPWSFNEMVKALAKNKQTEAILCLYRVFSQSSHLIHADETALGVTNDRKNREDKLLLENLHTQRLYSDCISLYSWSLVSILTALNINHKNILETITSGYFERSQLIKKNNKIEI